MEFLPESGEAIPSFCLMGGTESLEADSRLKDRKCLDVGAALWSKLCAIEDTLRHRRCKAESKHHKLTPIQRASG